MDQIRSALGGDGDSLTARLLSQLSVEGRDSEPSNSAERPSVSENSFDLSVQMIEKEIVEIDRLANQIENEEALAEKSDMDSLAIPKAQSGGNILRYQVAMKGQIAADCKELGRLQEIRQSLELNPGPTGAKSPSLS